MANLDNISAEYLREILDQVEDADAAKRVMVAITFKEIDEVSQNRAAELYGFSSGWASRWFRRLERLETEPFEEVLYDEDRPGRPSKLSDDERDQFEAVLQESPEDVGIDAPAWTVSHARQYLDDTFDVEYSDRQIRRLLREAGLSWKTARPEFEKSDERAKEAFKDGFKKRRTIWTTNTRS